jgi:hypothetical protein
MFLYCQYTMPRKNLSRKSVPKRSRRKSAKRMPSRRKHIARKFRSTDSFILKFMNEEGLGFTEAAVKAETYFKLLDLGLSETEAAVKVETYLKLLDLGLSETEANQVIKTYKDYPAGPSSLSAPGPSSLSAPGPSSMLGVGPSSLSAPGPSSMLGVGPSSLSAPGPLLGVGSNDDAMLQQAIKLSLDPESRPKYYRLINTKEDPAYNIVTGKLTPGSGIRGNGKCFIHAFRLGYLAHFGNLNPIREDQIVQFLRDGIDNPEERYEFYVRDSREKLLTEIAKIEDDTALMVYEADVFTQILSDQFNVHIQLKNTTLPKGRNLIEAGRQHTRVIRLSTNLKHFELYLDQIPKNKENKAWHAAFKEIMDVRPSEPGLDEGNAPWDAL